MSLMVVNDAPASSRYYYRLEGGQYHCTVQLYVKTMNIYGGGWDLESASATKNGNLHKKQLVNLVVLSICN